MAADMSLWKLLPLAEQNIDDILRAVAEEPDVDGRHEGGYTPLMMAVLMGSDLRVIRALLERGADVNAENDEGMTPLMGSLLTESRLSGEKNDSAALVRERNRLAVVRELMNAGADVNAVCAAARYRKWTPLLFATLAPDKNAPVIPLLLKACISVNVRTKEQVTPLIYAAARGRSSEAILALVRAGADVNAAAEQEHKKGWTPLLYALASQQKSFPVVEALISSGADVNISVCNGLTPLMFAAVMDDDPFFADALLRAGADVLACDCDGNSALDCAKARNHKHIYSLLSRAAHKAVRR